ncbi:MAG: undecaprenyl-diphosphatase UppP [Gemmatimonadetes bacterium]|nr:MAG: undecaprenyl-diphosphatase UppP [Gemmatimonadota bacterium]
MTVLQAVILGLIQGLTEFLPVSSSGHLVLAQEILNVHIIDDITFEVFVHFGTVLSIITVFWHRIGVLLRSPIQVIQKKQRNRDFDVVVFIGFATIPAVIVGLLFKDPIESAFDNYLIVSCALLVTAAILFFTRFVPDQSDCLSAWKSIVIGIAQAFAIIPGISRSGSTICTALYLKVDKQEAAEFSFLMAIPVILGATLLKTKDILETGTAWDTLLPILAGTLAAYASGVVAIKLLLEVVKRGKLEYFAYYCALVGLTGIGWSVLS